MKKRPNVVNLKLLKKEREKRKIYQKDLAKALGKTPEAYCMQELGFARFAIHEAIIIRDYFGFTDEETKRIFGL